MNTSKDKESNGFKKPHGLKGYKAPQEVRDRISRATRSIPKKKEGQPHPLKGRPRPQEVRDKIRISNTGKPKNYDVWLKGRKGPNHPSYKHGKGAANREYDHEKHAAWIQGVKRASNFKCFITGQDHNLECHHLIGFKHEPTRYKIANGVAIATSLHKAFHAKYGSGYSTPAQFEEFCQENYNITSFPWRQGNHNPNFSLIEEQAKIVDMSQQKANKFAKTVQDRGHEIVDGTSYINNRSVLKIRCLKHEKTYDVIPGNYKKSRLGIPCCASEKQSAAVAKANRSRKK